MRTDWRNPQTALAVALLSAVAAAATAQPPAAEPNVMAALSRQVRRIAAEAGAKVLRIEVDSPVPADAPASVLVMTRRRVSTGFVVSEGGSVLTTAETVQVRSHWLLPGPPGGFREVRDVAKEAMTIDQDGRRRTARVVGTCQRSNLALLQVDGLDAAPVKLATEREMTPGSLVVALSAPGIPGNRMTLGLIDQMHLQTGTRKVEDLLSLSVPVGRGTIGAPVFDADGNVVGMISGSRPTWVIRPLRSGGQLLGLRDDSHATVAIPATFLKRAVPDLKTTGTVLYGYLGVKIAEATDRVTVDTVMADSPASRAELRPGDRLLSLDGEPVANPHDFQRRIIDRRPGEQVTLTVNRGGARVRVKVVLGRRPQPQETPRPAAIAVRNSFEQMRRRLMRLPGPQRVLLETQLRDHLQNMHRTLEKELERLKQQIEVFEGPPASRPADEEP